MFGKTTTTIINYKKNQKKKVKNVSYKQKKSYLSKY